MSRITYYPRYTTPENVVTNTTLHLFSQINQHSADTFRAFLGELLGDADLPLGINFQQQTRSANSIPDGSILQEPVHVVIETKVTAGVDIDQLIRHCGSFEKGKNGNHLLLLTKDKVDKKFLEPVISKAKEIGAAFWNVTFEELCASLKDLAKAHETHLLLVVEDYAAYCADMNLLPDRRKWMRIVPCGETFALNQQWHVYYQPTERSYSNHDFIGIYTQKAVRLVGHVAAIYDNKTDDNGVMQMTLFSGTDRPEFRQRIIGIIADSKTEVGWDLESDYRFFCAEEFVPTLFEKTSSGGIQGPRFWDISAQAEKAINDAALAGLLRKVTWE